MKIEELIAKLNFLSCKYHNKVKEMETIYPQIGKNDARNTFFNKCIAVFDCLLLLCISRVDLFTHEYFKNNSERLTIREGLEDEFYVEHGDSFGTLDKEEAKELHFTNLIVHEIDSFVPFTYFHGIFVAFESTFRMIYQRIGKRPMPTEFFKILDDLKPKLSLTNYSEFFSILLNILILSMAICNLRDSIFSQFAHYLDAI